MQRFRYYVEQAGRVLWYFRKQLSDRQFLLVVSVLVGLLSGGAAILLKSFVFYVHHYQAYLRISELGRYGMALSPALGIISTVFLIRYLWPNEFNKGLAPVVRSIRTAGGKLPFSQTYNHILTSALTVGFGGSAGLESPIVSTGSAIGSNFADFNQLRIKERTLLLACGIAAGVAAAFNAPIAGVLFAAEVFLIEISLSAIIPVILASATGALLSKMILGETILLHFEMKEAFRSENLPFYLILGLLSGFLSLWFSRTSHWFSLWFKQFTNPYAAALTGSLLLGALLLVFPSFYGEGYSNIKDLASFQTYRVFEGSLLGNFMERKTWWFIIAIFLTALFKAFATSFTLGSGGNGGQFAPALFIGANAGFAFSMACHKLGFISVSISNFTIVGMAGVLSGVFYAPMTGIFLIAELTGGYELMIPLMIVSALSYSVVRKFEPISIELKNIAAIRPAAGFEEKEILQRLTLHRLLETDYDPISPDMKLDAFIPVLRDSAHNTFPVVSAEGRLLGLVVFSKVKELIFRAGGLEKMTVFQVMSKPKSVILDTDSIPAIVEKFERSQAFRLPVCIGDRYAGFITKGTLLGEYRKEIVHSYREQQKGED
jgi:CIC family chloride channel protein